MDEIKDKSISQFFISWILRIPAGPRFHLAVLRMSFYDLNPILAQDMGRQS